LQPGAWFVLSAPSGFGLRTPLSKCSVHGDIDIANDGASDSMLKLSRAISSSASAKNIPAGAGSFLVETSVLEETFSHPRFGYEVADRMLQLQVRVQNNSPEGRLVMLSGRDLNCARGTAFAWMLGSEEAISGLSSGPVEIAPGDWTVFSQRLGGTGPPEHCHASISVSEVIRGLNAFAGSTLPLDKYTK
jgi:hypothetical protein